MSSNGICLTSSSEHSCCTAGCFPRYFCAGGGEAEGDEEDDKRRTSVSEFKSNQKHLMCSSNVHNLHREFDSVCNRGTFCGHENQVERMRTEGSRKKVKLVGSV